jgi:hypothetical protein
VMQETQGIAVTFERRSEPRGATVFRPVLIESRGMSNVCLVRNLSPSGMKARVYTELHVGDAVTVQFVSGAPVRGRVTWCQTEHAGVEFAEPINVADVLASTSQRAIDGKLNRAVRVPLGATCELTVDGRTLCEAISDISQRGLKALTSYLRDRDQVIVHLQSLGERRAVVRWTRPGMAGLNFLRPLSFDELAKLVVELTSETGKHDRSSLNAAPDEGGTQKMAKNTRR